MFLICAWFYAIAGCEVILSFRQRKIIYYLVLSGWEYFLLENLVIFLLLPLAILLSVRRKTRGQEKNYFFRPMSCGGGASMLS